MTQRKETALGRRAATATSNLRPSGIGPSASSNQQPHHKRDGSWKDSKKDDSRFNPLALSPDEDILFLGRNRDRVYMCERNADSFRILRLSPLE